MFDKVIEPILLYEGLGFHNSYLYQKLPLKFYNIYLTLEGALHQTYWYFGNWEDAPF